MQIQPASIKFRANTYLQTCKGFDKGCIWYMGPTTQVNQRATSIHSDSFVCRKIIDDFNLITVGENKNISEIDFEYGRHIRKVDDNHIYL